MSSTILLRGKADRIAIDYVEKVCRDDQALEITADQGLPFDLLLYRLPKVGLSPSS